MAGRRPGGSGGPGRTPTPEEAWAAADRVLAEVGAPGRSAFEPLARRYLEAMARWNAVARLTGYPDEATRVTHLLVESLLTLRAVPDAAGPLLDIGSGAGVPGLVLKLARPDWAVTLVEANRRRANFLRHAVRVLELAGVDVIQARAEDLAARPEHQGRYGLATLRAVVDPARAAALARPFLAPGGRAVVLLSQEAARSLPRARVRRVTGPGAHPALSAARAFLIIDGTDPLADGPGTVPRGTADRAGGRPAQLELPGTVPRGTPRARETTGASGAHPGGRQSEGRRRQDHDRR